MRTPLPLLVTALAATALVLPATASARGVLPPANDDIADAASISVGDSTDGTTVGASREETDPADLNGQHTVWYSFRAGTGRPVEVSTQVANGGVSSQFVVYRGTPGDLETVARGSTPDPSMPTGLDVARFPVTKGATYFIGIAGGGSGAPFELSVDQAKEPSSVTFPDGRLSSPEGRPQLYAAPGDRPRVRVLVRTGFPGDRAPGRGPVVLRKSDTDRTFRATLRHGRATFVLPRIRHSYEIVVRYPGTARTDALTVSAYMNANALPQRTS